MQARGMSSQTDSVTTPQIEFRRSAKALITVSGRVLLIREQHADGSTFWTLPGGGLDVGESYSEALSRELAEELRCLATITDPLTELWYAHTSDQHRLSLCRMFRCELRSSVTPNPKEGVFEYRWVCPDDLPPKTLLPIQYVIERGIGDGERQSVGSYGLL